MSDEKKHQSKGFEAAKKWLTKPSQEIYETFLKTNKSSNLGETTLLGIYNVKNKEITLIPCIRDRVVLVYNDDEEFVGGWAIDSTKNLTKLRDLFTNEIEQYNESGEVPRFLYTKKDYDLDPTQDTTIFEDNRITAHEYLIRIKGVEQNIADYRGFAVIPRDDPQYAWTSGSLNSPRDHQGTIITRINSARMDGKLQKEVQDKVATWGIIREVYPSFMNPDSLIERLDGLQLSFDPSIEDPNVLQAMGGAEKFELSESEKLAESKKFAEFEASALAEEDDMDNFLSGLIGSNEDSPRPTSNINPPNPGTGNNQLSFAVEIGTDINTTHSSGESPKTNR